MLLDLDLDLNAGQPVLQCLAGHQESVQDTMLLDLDLDLDAGEQVLHCVSGHEE